MNLGNFLPTQLNPDVNAFQRKFVNEVRRCEEMERKLSKYIFYIFLKLKATVSVWWNSLHPLFIYNDSVINKNSGCKVCFYQSVKVHV